MQAFLPAQGLEFTKVSMKFHEALNFPGYVPFLGTLTGAIRAITALAATIIFTIAAKLTNDLGRKIDFSAAAATNQMMISRGILEMIPFIGGYMAYNQDQEIKKVVEVANLFLNANNVFGNQNFNNMKNMFGNANVKNMMNMFGL